MDESPKKPVTPAPEPDLTGIPKEILAKISRYPILRRLAPGEAFKVWILVANYWETCEVLTGARDLETLLRVGPQRLIQGTISGTEWDEGLRMVRTKMRELREALTRCAEQWKITLGHNRRASPSEAKATDAA